MILGCDLFGRCPRKWVNVAWNAEDLYKLPSNIGGADYVIKADKICGGLKTVRAFPVINGKIVKGMADGNFVYTSDSRFPAVADFSYPIPVMDRIED